ncbi:MAG TPA: thymidine phosphorylase [Verrucomicrobiae bacterium]|jgi:pyrimidine-nucleoside phosphorylase
MNLLALIEAKRDGHPLSADHIAAFISDYVSKKIPDYQMAALLMAIFFRGLNAEETRALTLAMRDSGDVLKFPDDPRPLVDKHSTGGVGDKVSLPLAPLLACLGFRVPMISGRGLGITGGTLDKLESIPGFTTALPPHHIIAQVQSLGLAMVGQTANMVPADKALYALRDVTATVPSIPLITASILSKKLAEGLQALVMDVKFGCAAFMQTQEQARTLAQSIVTLARDCGVNTHALLTDMNAPLGRAAGNWLEVRESMECLEGRGPDDLKQLVIDLAAHLLVQTGRAPDLETARAQASACLTSGQPRRKWDDLIVAQGADLAAFNRKLALDHTAPVVKEFDSPRDGFVTHCDARLIGEIVRDLGGGRMTKESVIHPDVGIDRLVKPGETVRNEPLCRVHACTEAEADEAVKRLAPAFALSTAPPKPNPLIAEIL